MLQLERIKLRADISSDMEKMYKRLFNVSYYKRICEQSATQAGVQSILSCVRTFNNEDDGNPRYLFVLIKPHANDTAQTNYQRCCHANISSITARYSSNTYPLLPQSADWSRNQYSRFYKEFIRVSKSLGNSNPGLSMQEFRDLYTIYALDLSAQAAARKTNQLTITITRRTVPDQNDQTLQNPRDFDAFFVIISEAKIQIDCLNKVTRKI